jgi:hypothetical protein
VEGPASSAYTGEPRLAGTGEPRLADISDPGTGEPLGPEAGVWPVATDISPYFMSNFYRPRPLTFSRETLP